MPEPSDLNHPCGKCAFYQNSVWQPVKAGAMAVLTHGFTRKPLAADQVLFAQGEENQGVFCVSAGLIAVRTHHANGSSTLLKLAYPGDVIGFRSFLTTMPHKTEARALLPSRVCIVALPDANQVVRENSAVLARLTARCIYEIDQSHERIIAAATVSNKQRLADLLLRLMQTHGVRVGEQMQMHLPVSRSDLADLIGVQPETMSRLFTRLKEEGSFTVSGRHIQLPVGFAALVSSQQEAQKVAQPY